MMGLRVMMGLCVKMGVVMMGLCVMMGLMGLCDDGSLYEDRGCDDGSL